MLLVAPLRRAIFPAIKASVGRETLENRLLLGRLLVTGA
jgi:hypothetical protein